MSDTIIFSKEVEHSITYEVEFVENTIVLVYKLTIIDGKSFDKQLILSRSFWDKRAKSYGKKWLLKRKVPEKEQFGVVTEEMMKKYLTGHPGRTTTWLEKNPCDVVRKEGTARVYNVRDLGWSYMLYGLDGEIIRRPQYFDYCSGHINDESWDLDAVEKWMTMNKLTHLVTTGKEMEFEGCPEKFSLVKRVEIPYYNRGLGCGLYAIEYAYLADPEEFAEYIRVEKGRSSLNDWHMKETIENMIPKEFKLESKGCVEYDDEEDW